MKTEGVTPVTAPPQKPEAGIRFPRLLHDLYHRRQNSRQAVGVALVFLLTFLGTPVAIEWALGAAVVVLGMAIRLWASGYVMKNEVLATVGPYGYVRHPLYVGNLTIAFGFCIASGLWWSWPLTVAMILYYYPHTIRYEDKKLHRLFGESWERWSKETRALVPRTTPWRGDGDQSGAWHFRTSMMRNGEPVHILIGGLCLAWLFRQF